MTSIEENTHIKRQPIPPKHTVMKEITIKDIDETRLAALQTDAESITDLVLCCDMDVHLLEHPVWTKLINVTYVQLSFVIGESHEKVCQAVADMLVKLPKLDTLYACVCARPPEVCDAWVAAVIKHLPNLKSLSVDSGTHADAWPLTLANVPHGLRKFIALVGTVTHEQRLRLRDRCPDIQEIFSEFVCSDEQYEEGAF